MRNILSYLALLLVANVGSLAAESDHFALQLGQSELTIEVARTATQRAKGLSRRHQLAPNAGMVFVNETPEATCMWMRDTYIPLDAAFITRAGVVDKIVTMTPLSLQTHCAKVPIVWVVEAPARWFAKHGLYPGATINSKSLEHLKEISVGSQP